MWNSTAQFCNARSNFDKCHYISCLRAEFAAKHTKAPLSFIMRWRMESDFGSWQSPYISHSHLYRGTIAWTPPTAIYREHTVSVRRNAAKFAPTYFISHKSRYHMLYLITQYQPETFRKMINSMGLGDMAKFLKAYFSNSVYKTVAWAFTVKSLSGVYRGTSRLTSLYCSSIGLVPSGNKPLP